MSTPQSRVNFAWQREQKQKAQAEFRAAKLHPEARNRESDASERLRKMHRERRKEHGRPKAEGPKRRRWPRRR